MESWRTEPTIAIENKSELKPDRTVISGYLLTIAPPGVFHFIVNAPQMETEGHYENITPLKYVPPPPPKGNAESVQYENVTGNIDLVKVIEEMSGSRDRKKNKKFSKILASSEKSKDRSKEGVNGVSGASKIPIHENVCIDEHDPNTSGLSLSHGVHFLFVMLLANVPPWDKPPYRVT
ncbi:hypothetical protein TELCIR_16322, partial [Teladorsagia circumcincta]